MRASACSLCSWPAARTMPRHAPRRRNWRQRSRGAGPPGVSRERRAERARQRHARRADRGRIRRRAVQAPRVQGGRRRRQLRADGRNDAADGDGQAVDRHRRREVDLRQGVRHELGRRAFDSGPAGERPGRTVRAAPRSDRLPRRGESGPDRATGAGRSRRDSGAAQRGRAAMGHLDRADADSGHAHHRHPAGGARPHHHRVAVRGRRREHGRRRRRHARPHRHPRGRAAKELHLQCRRDASGTGAVRRRDPDHVAPRSPGPPRDRAGAGQDLQRRGRRRVGNGGGDGDRRGAGQDARRRHERSSSRVSGARKSAGTARRICGRTRPCRSRRSWRTWSSR